MSTPHSNLPGDTGNAAQVDLLLQQAEVSAAAEDWEKTIETYRTLLTFDRVIQGAEAKLQWALRMRDIEALYRQGKAELQAQHYAEALAALRKARLMYASHFKDTDALIVEAQTAMQKGNWQARPPAATTKKGCLLTGGTLTLLAVLYSLPVDRVRAGAYADAINHYHTDGAGSANGPRGGSRPQAAPAARQNSHHLKGATCTKLHRR